MVEGGYQVKPSVCMCCGEPMTPKSPALSGNPNICASCVSFVDDLDDRDAPVPGASVPEPSSNQAGPEPQAGAGRESASVTTGGARGEG